MSRFEPLPLLFAATLAAGCGSTIHAQYEEARLEALADPGPTASDWAADGELGLSWDLVTTLAVRELQQRLESPDSRLRIELPLGAEASLAPRVELTETEIGPARACDACVRVSAGFDGELDWKLGSLKGSVPMNLNVQAVLEMVARAQGEATVVEAQLKRATVELPKDLQVDRLRVDLNDPLVRWLQGLIEREFPPIPVAEIGTDEVPVRAVRLGAQPEYLTIQVLTSSPVRSEAALTPLASGDWYLSLDERVLLGLARREAFETGELDFEVYADPQSLAVDERAFTMGLRLWRLAGAGWWRDYQVSGTLEVEDQQIKLEPSDVVELDHSRGAGLVDPLALLAKGIILDAIEDALQIARPAKLQEPIGGAKLVLTVDRAQGGSGALSLQGSAEIQERKQGKKDKGQKSGSEGGSGSGSKKSKSSRSQR